MNNLFKRNTARKIFKGTESSPCWFCGNPTQHVCNERDGSEILCCISYLWGEEKVRQFNPKTRKYSSLIKKRKKMEYLCVNSGQNTPKDGYDE